MPTRNPFGVVVRAPAAFLISATALSVTPMAIVVSVPLSFRCPSGVPVSVRRRPVAVRPVPFGPLRLVVGDRALDRVLGQDRAMDLHGRQVELLDDLRVL